MSAIDELVPVTITTSSSTVPIPAFNVVLFAGNTGFPNGSADLTRSYGSLAAVLADFANTTPEYKAAEQAFALDRKPSTIKIGYVPTPVAGVYTLTFGAAPTAGDVITGDVNGVAITPVDFNTDEATTLAALATQLKTFPSVADATVAGSVVTVTAVQGYSLTLSSFACAGGSAPAIAIGTTTAQVLWSDGLAALRLFDAKWYGLVIASFADGPNLDVAEWAEANPVAFMAQSSGSSLKGASTTDVQALLVAKGYKRTGMAYHSIDTEYLAFTALIEFLSYSPGSATMMYKDVTGMTVDPLTGGQADVMRGIYDGNGTGRNINIFTDLSGVRMLEPGVAVGGQFLDILVGSDWLRATLQQDIITVQTSGPKVPYTDAGVAMFEAAARKRIKLAQDQGIVATVPKPTFTVPLISSLTQAQRAARVFPGIKISGQQQGAINAAGFDITLLP